MRGLPPVPDDVLRLELDFDVNGRRFTTGLWMLTPGLQAWTPTWLTSFASDVFSYLLPGTTGVTHDGTSLTTCRVLIAGSSPIAWTAYAPPNHGAHTGGQADAIASGVYVVSSSGGRGSGSRIRFPGCPDDFITDNWLLSPQGQSRLLDMCSSIIELMNAVTSPTSQLMTLGTLQRATVAGPRSTSQFDPASLVVPSNRVEVLRRRFPHSRWVSPL